MQGDQANRAPGWVTVKEAAALARVSRQTVHLWIAHGRVKAVPTDDGDLRLDTEEFDRFLTMRRAASVAGVRLETLRHWMDQTGGVWAAAALLGTAMLMACPTRRGSVCGRPADRWPQKGGRPAAARANSASPREVMCATR